MIFYGFLLRIAIRMAWSDEISTPSTGTVCADFILLKPDENQALFGKKPGSKVPIL